jgi:serine/threonine protein kinase
LCDFGTAKTSASQTMTGSIGTLMYMSPEVLRSDRLYNESCDVYSFGITTYEVFFEIRPYSSIKRIGHVTDEEEEEYSSLFNLGYKVLSGYRPAVPLLDYSEQETKYLEIMRRCWDQESKNRPSFSEVYSLMEELK